MNESSNGRMTLNPLLRLEFHSGDDRQIWNCASGRLKWLPGTRTLSIKVAIIDGDLEMLTSSMPFRIVVHSEDRILAFQLREDCSVKCTHWTVSPNFQSSHYVIEGSADFINDATFEN